MATQPLPPGATIGILGGGQLGRMLSAAASRLGLNCVFFCPDGDSPARALAHNFIHAEYTDMAAARRFAGMCDVLTYEFENIPLELGQLLTEIKPLHPSISILEIAQDRVWEKQFIHTQAKVPVTAFVPVDSLEDLQSGLETLGLPAILKTRRLGYDGKGQKLIQTQSEAAKVWQLFEKPSILEAFVPFKRELSVICARSISGQIAIYPLIENQHKNHILHTSVAPANTSNKLAIQYGQKILEKLDYRGVLAVEFFECAGGELYVNEIAPRVHNSGHWTQNAGCIDQFEQHIRAICGWPLGKTQPLYQIEMRNLLGHDINMWPELSQQPDTFLHLYGKTRVKPGRKMGHVNRITGRSNEC